MTAYASYSDKDLLLVLQSGDQAAFTEIYNRHHQGIYFYGLGFVKDPALAEELVHEVFIKLWKIRGSLEVQSSFEGYLCRMAHNKAINMLKNIARNDALRLRALKHLAMIRVEESVDPRELERYDNLLEDAINSLSPECRKVFVLCRQDGRTYDQAASEIGISINTVKYHMRMATKNLRQFLLEKGEIALALLLIEHFC